MEIYSSSSLPKDGWIRACFNCCRPTGKITTYVYRDENHELYMCKECLQKHKDTTRKNKIKFNMSVLINRYIEDRTLEPFKYPSISLEPPKIYRMPMTAPIPPRISSEPTILKKTFNVKKDYTPVEPNPPSPRTPPSPSLSSLSTNTISTG